MLIQRDELENDRASLSDESGPDEIEPKLLRKQLLEVSGVFSRQQVSVSVSLNLKWLFVVQISSSYLRLHMQKFIICELLKLLCLQCFDAVGWMTGRASSL